MALACVVASHARPVRAISTPRTMRRLVSSRIATTTPLASIQKVLTPAFASTRSYTCSSATGSASDKSPISSEARIRSSDCARSSRAMEMPPGAAGAAAS